LLLALNSLLFVAAVLALRIVFARWVVPMLTQLRSVELVILFGLVVLVGFCLGAAAAGLPPALGAFAAGLALSGNRLTGQVDALILPYRESFGVVFFVSLGTLLDPSVLMDEPLLLIGALFGVLLIKAGGATMAVRASGLPWHAAAGIGLGLAHLGELSFVLLSAGVHEGVITQLDYNRILFVAMGTLILTPQLLTFGLRWTRRSPPTDYEVEDERGHLLPALQEATLIGLGPIGRQVASQLEIMGIDVCLIDSNPVNLHAYAQQGFRTISGDASDPDVLERSDAAHSRLAVVCVPEDRVALQIVKSLRRLNASCNIVVRCRYEANAHGLKKAGASAVVSEEAQASEALLRVLKSMMKTN
jgi:CPA2 family monovalent cation:H+ antiporter-2